MDYYIRFQNTITYCGNKVENVQTELNVAIAPYLKGYSPRTPEIKNLTWHYGKNVCVLKKSNEKTSFFVYRSIKSYNKVKKEKDMQLTKQEQALLYEKGFFTAGANDAIVVITRKKLEELGVVLEDKKKK